MADPETTTRDEADESPEGRRTRQSARDVADWEAAFAAGKQQSGVARPGDADSANAGAIVSRAHRAEKGSGRRDAPRSTSPPDTGATS